MEKLNNLGYPDNLLDLVNTVNDIIETINPKELIISKSKDSKGSEEFYFTCYSCKKCGCGSLGSGDNFCSKCGTKIKWVE